MPRRRLVVVGAGISGLAAAWVAAREAERVEDGLEVVVLERDGDVGGRSLSLQRDGWLVEGGPGGYLDTEPRMVRLVQEAELEEEQIRARDAASRRFLYHGGTLHQIGGNPLKPLRSGLLGVGGALRALGEPLVRPWRGDGEESIHEFCRRRLGRQVADRIVRTAMLGIFAGDAERLSVDACFPELRRLEQEHGSVLRGALARRRARKGEPEPEGPRPSRKLTSFQAGLQRLPRKLASHAGLDVRTGVEVVALESADSAPTTDGPVRAYALGLADGGRLEADAVVLATPIQASARLLQALAPDAAGRLARVPVPPVVVAGLGFTAAAAKAFPEGFGMLVARGEGIRMLGCLWETRIYPGRSPDDRFLARAMFGGRVDPEVGDLEDDAIVELAAVELRSILGVAEAPVFREVVRWPHAIPQYEIGHVGIRRDVKRALEALPGLYLAGDALDGVSYPKTAAAGMRQAERAVEYLVGRRDQS